MRFFSRHYIELDAAITERSTCHPGSIVPDGEGGEGEGDEEEAAKVIAFLGKDENGESVQVSPCSKQESSKDENGESVQVSSIRNQSLLS